MKLGRTVLIKPNQTVYYSAEGGCAIDPLVVGALIRLARQAGASRVQVGKANDQTPNRMVGIPDGTAIREAPLPAPLLEPGEIPGNSSLPARVNEYLGVLLEQVSIRARPGHEGFDYLPVNLPVGSGVTLAGAIGHVKSALDSMLRRGELSQVIWLRVPGRKVATAAGTIGAGALSATELLFGATAPEKLFSRSNRRASS